MVWANVIWLLPFRKKLTLYSSPLVVVWVWFILVTSYLYSMELNHQELPPKWGFVNLASGFVIHTTFSFWLSNLPLQVLIRQATTNRFTCWPNPFLGLSFLWPWGKCSRKFSWRKSKKSWLLPWGWSRPVKHFWHLWPVVTQNLQTLKNLSWNLPCWNVFRNGA